MQRAVSTQQIVSPHPYKKDYKEQVMGKGPQDPTIGYPEHDHHKKVGELASSVRVPKVVTCTLKRKIYFPFSLTAQNAKRLLETLFFIDRC